MSIDLHFACTGCGKCCDAPPTVTISEALGLYRDFVLTVRLAGPIADAAMPAEHPAVVAYRSQSAHLLARGAERFDLRVEGRHFEATLNIYGGAVRAGVDDPCAQLQPDGLCGIYERRPQRCRTVPFDYWLPEGSAVANGSDRLTAAIKRGWLCDVSPDAPVVAVLGEAPAFAPGPYGVAYADALELMERQGPALGLISHAFVEELNRDPAVVKSVISALAMGQAVDFSFLRLLQGLDVMARGIAADGWVVGGAPIAPGHRALLEALPPIAAFLDGQIPLIQAAIALNLQRKRPADRPLTERLRALLTEYTALRATI